MIDWRNPPPDPTPEELAAYADGELEPHHRAHIANWLVQHPEAFQEVESEKNLLQFWRGQPVSEPSPQAWEAALSQIAARLPGPEPIRRKRWLPALFLAGLTAAALAAILIVRWLGPGDTNSLVPGLEEETFEIASDNDVIIVSMDGNDTSALVVGRLPWPSQEVLPVISNQEVTYISLDGNDTNSLVIGQPPVEGAITLTQHFEVELVRWGDPDIRLEDWNMPMIVDPLLVAGTKKP